MNFCQEPAKVTGQERGKLNENTGSTATGIRTSVKRRVPKSVEFLSFDDRMGLDLKFQAVRRNAIICTSTKEFHVDWGEVFDARHVPTEDTQVGPSNGAVEKGAEEGLVFFL